MKSSVSAVNRKNIASLLKLRRNQLQPEEVGLPRGGKRRTAGLRREEVSSLAGISSEWYSWLEQGRDIRASAKALMSISRVLKMDFREQALLLGLSGYRNELDQEERRALSPKIQALLDQQYPFPAYALDSHWELLGWNEAVHAIFLDLGKELENRNALYLFFTSERFREMLVDWDMHAKGVISKLRSLNLNCQDEIWLTDTIRSLKELSPDFERLWNESELSAYRDGTKVYQHPEVGPLSFDYISLKTFDEWYQDIRIVIYMPKDIGTESKLNTLFE